MIIKSDLANKVSSEIFCKPHFSTAEVDKVVRAIEMHDALVDALRKIAAGRGTDCFCNRTAQAALAKVQS